MNIFVRPLLMMGYTQTAIRAAEQDSKARFTVEVYRGYNYRVSAITAITKHLAQTQKVLKVLLTHLLHHSSLPLGPCQKGRSFASHGTSRKSFVLHGTRSMAPRKCTAKTTYMWSQRHVSRVNLGGSSCEPHPFHPMPFRILLPSDEKQVGQLFHHGLTFLLFICLSRS